jgi:2,4-dienoyl-CoA reductase (NADPH2)
MKLLSPINIGAMSLKNRMVMAPMTTNYANADQTPSQRLQDFLVERARGGVGLITVEVCTVDVRQKYQPQSMTLGSDDFIEHHQRLVDAIHAHGARVQPQITHPGPESMISVYHGEVSVGPSHGTAACHGLPSRELAIAELDDIVEAYARACLRARMAGYDGVELHAAHAYMLLACFLSPLKNKRRDEYGSDTAENRTRLLIRVLQRIKQVAGEDFPITLRISGFERVPGGRDSWDTASIAPMLVAAGVDAFHISGGISDPMVSQMICGSEFPDGYNVPEAEAIKHVVDVPVMVVGRFLDPELAEQTLLDNKADLIVMGRPLLADPQLPNKVAAGKIDRIRRCISCQNCIDSMFMWPMDARMNCAVNAASGREAELSCTPAENARHVVVIGSGPAGMEAARVAATRGHRVTLLERQHRLGGALFIAATVHRDNERLLTYLTNELSHLDVQVQLGVVADVESVSALKPDAVVVATGASLIHDAIPGADGANVISGGLLRELANGRLENGNKVFGVGFRALLSLLGPLLQRHLKPEHLRRGADWWLPLGRRIIMIGADLAAIEVAEFLARRKRTVSILAREHQLAPDIGPKRRHEHEKRLEATGVSINIGVDIAEITPRGVSLRLPGGQQRLVAADTVVLAGTPGADNTLYRELSAAGLSCHIIGDASEPGLIVKAIFDGNSIAQQL